MKGLATHFRERSEAARAERVWLVLDRNLSRRERWRDRSRWAAFAAMGCSLLAICYFGARFLGAGSDTPQVLVLADGSRIEHALNVSVAIEVVTPERVELRMSSGRAQFSVTPNRAREFITHAGGYSVRVLGTEYSVELAKPGLQVEVTRGEVEVRSDSTGETWHVRAHERWRSELRVAAAKDRGQSGPDPATRPPLSASGQVAPQGTMPNHPQPSAGEPLAAAASSRVHGARFAGGAPPAGASRASQLSATDKRRAQSELARSPLSEADVPQQPRGAEGLPRHTERGADPPSAVGLAPPRPAAELRGAERRPLEAAQHLAADARGAEPVPARSPDAAGAAALFERAQQARLKSDHHASLQLLAAFLERFPEDSRAGLVAFQLGRLRLEQGDARGALAAFERAQRVGDAFKEQVQARRVQALEELGENAACREARLAFLRTYADSAFAEVVRHRCP